MTAQAFFYNAIFFTYALVLTDFYGVPGDRIGWYLLPFALGNFLGPLLLGRFFDVIGRRKMIATTYALSAVLLTASGYMFQQHWLTATTQTISWMVIFFFASAAASSAYLTISESFPLEIRALAIAVFYAFGTRARRNRGAGILRPADRYASARRSVLRLSDRIRADARSRGDRRDLGRGCGAALAGERGPRRCRLLSTTIEAGRVQTSFFHAPAYATSSTGKRARTDFSRSRNTGSSLSTSP